MTKTLTQVIIDTKGATRIVTQERDTYGRFTGTASVSDKVADGICGVKTVNGKVSETPLVVVQYSYKEHYQTSMSVNRTTKVGRVKTYVNDGRPMTDQNRLDFNAQI